MGETHGSRVTRSWSIIFAIRDHQLHGHRGRSVAVPEGEGVGGDALPQVAPVATDIHPAVAGW